MLKTTECSLCFQDFKEDEDHTPKIMSCGDSFCVKCINSLIIDDKIVCPICKSVIMEKIDEMPINKYALNEKKLIVCDICLGEYSNIVNSKKLPRVLKCGHTFCTECLEKARHDDKIMCIFCGEETYKEVKELSINKCVTEEYENEILLNFKYMDKEIIDINDLDFKFSVGLMGESIGGKTSIAHYFYTGESIVDNVVSTIGYDYHFKFVSCKDKTIKITLWDTAGQERFGSLSAGALRGVQALLLVFSLTPIFSEKERVEFENAQGEEKSKIQKEYTKKTFKTVDFWLNQFHSFNKQEKKIIFLLGNKCDDVENRIIKLKDAKKYADEHELKYYETSAKTGRNIKKVFEDLTLKLMETYPCIVRKNTKNSKKTKNIKLQKRSNNTQGETKERRMFC